MEDQELSPPDAKRAKLEVSALETKDKHDIENKEMVKHGMTGEGTDGVVSTSSGDNGLENKTDVSTAADKVPTESDAHSAGSCQPDPGAVGPSLEVDVGITRYIGSHTGFHGVIKQRYSDFLVNEISQNGEVVQLSNIDEMPSLHQHATGVNQADPDVGGVLDADQVSQLKELLTSGDKAKSVLLQVGDDKVARTKIHSTVAKCFPGLDTTTITKDDKKYIQVKITANRGNGLRNWPKGQGDYCRFVLYKENKDTMDTVSLIAKLLSLKGSLFQYAGTKDKRAKTSQEVTAYRLSAEKLKGVNKRLRNICTGNYSYVKSPLRLGQLQGNKFTVVLRSVSGTSDQVEEAITSLRDHGFINYYGMQRFGTMAVPTHHIGKALLQSNWKEAVELILKPRPGDDQEVAAARTLWWDTRDAQKALHKFPRRYFIERAVLQGLLDNGCNNYMAALNKISRNTRLMYVHSYQSYIWNQAVSSRLEHHGMSPVCGDLAMPRGATLPGTDIEDTDPEAADTVEKQAPVVVDESNISTFTICDVVLPLPGYDVIYPGNELKALYERLMSADGLDCNSMRHKVKDYSLSGAYRHIMVKPDSVTWIQYQYNDPNIQLALSDWDRWEAYCCEVGDDSTDFLLRYNGTEGSPQNRYIVRSSINPKRHMILLHYDGTEGNPQDRYIVSSSINAT